MTEHRIANARGATLLRALAGLGLVRVLGAERGRLLRCRYEGNNLVLDTTIDDLQQWLVHDYVPTPVLSPWNGGSGFGEKDKTSKAKLDDLLTLATPRLDPMRTAFAICDELAARAQMEGWPKDRLVRTLRNHCPDSMLPWIDASVIQLDGTLAFPPLLGTGGNDGRLDFSTNFHQRLLEVLPPARVVTSAELAAAHLGDVSVSGLSRAAVGQFDPGAAGTPGSSPYGSADALVNPWAYILMIEGAMLFAAAPVRRLAADTRNQSRAAMPFMTHGSPHGSTTGAGAEDTRGELWMPYFTDWLSPAGVRRLFEQGRAVWQGRHAVRTGQMYLAIGSGGTDSRARGFERYTFAQRNGLAFSAVRVADVVSREDTALNLVAQLERWPNQVLARSTGAVHNAATQVERTQIAFAGETGSPASRQGQLRDYCAAVTRLDLAVARSSNARGQIAPRPAPAATGFADLLLGGSDWASLLRDREFRIALGLASIVTAPLPGTPNGRSMRQLLLPLDPGRGRTLGWRDAAIVPGLGISPLEHVLAETSFWLVLHNAGDESGVAQDRVGPLQPAATVRGATGTRRGIGVPAADLNAWSATAIDVRALEQWFLALLAWDWRGVRIPLPRVDLDVIDPTFALLAPFRNGVGPLGANDTARSDSTRYGLSTQWIAQLRAGQLQRAHESATSRLHQLGYRSAPPAGRGVDGAPHGRRIAAALIPRITGVQAAMRTVTTVLRPSDGPPATASDSTIDDNDHDQTDEPSQPADLEESP